MNETPSSPDEASRGGPSEVFVSVVVPMYQEAARIGSTLEDLVPRLREAAFETELILVNDGSRDDTARIARDWIERAPEPGGMLARAKLLDFGVNRGKGAAVRDGLRVATGWWCLMMDADNACRIAELHKLLGRAAETGASLIAGSRTAPGCEVKARVHRYLIGRAFRLTQLALGVGLLSDTQCGFKLYRHDLARELSRRSIEDGYVFDVEHLLLARALGFTVADVGVAWEHRDGGRVNPLVDGFKMLARTVALKQRDLLEQRAAPGPAPEVFARTRDAGQVVVRPILVSKVEGAAR